MHGPFATDKESKTEWRKQDLNDVMKFTRKMDEYFVIFICHTMSGHC